MRRLSFVLGVLALAFPTVAGATDEMGEHASCMGLGASFYGQFAPQQMGLVAAIVNDQAMEAGLPPGGTYSFFAGEKEGGAIRTPCGTRLE